ncbi:TPA: hypothetical protein R6P06_001109 [Enterococcus faecalis]|uniref:hypothetical protein n=1 Tax=Enterococcus faecalis TaxID=1351 RepID=UPI000CF1FFAA|nr:hypothetical protein [Enterococcus faecalis]EHR4812443.1 hypothetical protein [Enterococcus faecalis]PQE71641.1 hypothetical protein CUT01_04995 [Enterococcus faecalis]PQF06109.1 hypothetical protein CUT03_06215 [Enterococcus faecalis]RXV93932.1 hypothetical protein CYQ23_03570 [Enterococcus faecalis]HED9418577.1 hypothetical protein [Enterococcus faecalis]
MSLYEEISKQEELENIELLAQMGIEVKTRLKKENFVKKDYINDNIAHIPNFAIPDMYFESFSVERINEGINSILQKNLIKKFDYNEWRTQNKYEPINFDEVIEVLNKFNTNIDNNNMEAYSIHEVNSKIYCLKEEVMPIKNFLKENNFIELSMGYGSSFTLEFPYSNSSFLCLNKDEDKFEKSVYYLHELGHVYHNYSKFRRKMLTSIETDEKVAHIVEYYLVRNIFNVDTMSHYIKLLYERLYNSTLLTLFQSEVYQNPNIYQTLSEKQVLFDNLKKYISNDVFDTSNLSWAYEFQIIQYPFYSGTYIYPILDVIKSIINKDHEDLSLENMLKLIY